MLASFASQLYVALIGIVMLPLYVKYMGAEAYGLVGFFAVLQACFNLLDIGLTPTIARQSAHFSGGGMDAASYRKLVRALEAIFLGVATLGTAVLLVAAPLIASDWLKASQLEREEVLRAVQLMAPTVGLRWMAGLYRGAISGLERLVWLGGFNAVVATLRFVGVLPVLAVVGTSPTVFFTFQLTVALLELAGLWWFAHRVFPRMPDGVKVVHDWAPLKPLLRFSMTIAFTSSIGVLLVQTDKLVLSSVLPLAEYGQFTLAVLAASGVLLVNGPVSSALLPRLVRLETQGDHAGLVQSYRRTTQLVAVIAGAASASLACCAEPLLRLWTGDEVLARQAASTLALYAIGNGVFSMAAFPYYLQFAKGNLRLHVIGNGIFLVLLAPLIIVAASTHGAVGAGFVWVGMNVLALLAWVPFVHRKFAPGINRRWYGRDVGPIVLAIAVVGLGGQALLPASADGPPGIGAIVLYAAALFAAGAAASSEMRAAFVAALGPRVRSKP
jgi:O-antigen/teichoic acid export membrane protein